VEPLTIEHSNETYILLLMLTNRIPIRGVLSLKYIISYFAHFGMVSIGTRFRYTLKSIANGGFRNYTLGTESYD